MLSRVKDWYGGLSLRGKLIAALVLGLVALLVALAAFLFFGKVAQAIAYLFSAGAGGLSGNEVKKLIADREQTEQDKDQIRQEADRQQEQSRRRQETQVLQFNRTLHKQNEAADNAALSGDDQALIRQAESNADQILGTAPTGDLPIVSPRNSGVRGGKNTINGLLPLLLPFFALFSGCASAGAAGSISPGASATVQIERSKLLKIIKSQNVCLRDLKAAKALYNGSLERQRILYESRLARCIAEKNQINRELAQIKHRNNRSWLPWVLFGVSTGISAIVIGYLAFKAFPIQSTGVSTRR